jgi:hypothetical protein
MYFHKIVFLLIVVLIPLAASNPAQGAPPAAKPSGSPTKIVQEASLANLPPAGGFSSVDGRFDIVLPKSISGFGALSPQQLGFNASGAMYQWRLREGFVLITFHDFLDPNFSVTTEQNFVDYFAGVRDSTLNALKAKFVSGSPSKLGEYRGYTFTFELPNGKRGFARSFYVDKRAYSLLELPSDTPASEALISKAFDTFRLIPKEDVNADIKRRIDAATPAALPQTPRAEKEKSDAYDEDLKGKVKTVIEISEDRSGTWGTQGRKMSSVEEYDQNGFKTKRVGYDSTGKPFQITVYGYLDGARVSNSKMIDYDDDPPLMALGTPSALEKPRDSRYEYKYAYKYVGGRLNERQLIRNNGSKGMRYVTNYQGNQKEELVYDNDGKLNMKFLYKLDDNGNEIERTFADVLGVGRGDQHYVIKYEAFDERGNWTKSLTSKLVEEAGKKVYKDWYVTYRTITYY